MNSKVFAVALLLATVACGRAFHQTPPTKGGNTLTQKAVDANCASNLEGMWEIQPNSSEQSFFEKIKTTLFVSQHVVITKNDKGVYQLGMNDLMDTVVLDGQTRAIMGNSQPIINTKYFQAGENTPTGVAKSYSAKCEKDASISLLETSTVDKEGNQSSQTFTYRLDGVTGKGKLFVHVGNDTKNARELATLVRAPAPAAPTAAPVKGPEVSQIQPELSMTP